MVRSKQTRPRRGSGVTIRHRRSARAAPATSSSSAYLYGIAPEVASRYWAQHRPRCTFVTVDVGITHLGLCEWSVDAGEWLHPRVERLARIDLCQWRGEWCDRVDRWCDAYEDWFAPARWVLVERQPPKGLVHIEQLVVRRWRDKAILVSPCSVLAHFRLGARHGYRYAERKLEVEAIAERYLALHGSAEARAAYDACRDRRHDLGDSVLLGLFFVERKRIERHQYLLAPPPPATASLAANFGR